MLVAFKRFKISAPGVGMRHKWQLDRHLADPYFQISNVLIRSNPQFSPRLGISLYLIISKKNHALCGQKNPKTNSKSSFLSVGLQRWRLAVKKVPKQINVPCCLFGNLEYVVRAFQFLNVLPLIFITLLQQLAIKS